MKVLLITDQHFGVRNDNQYFIEHYKKFYSQIVVPFIKSHNIKEIINLGDTFDRRRSINFMSLDEAKQMWFDPITELGCHMVSLIGNHDIYYKNTLRINAPTELLGEYKNFDVIDKPTTCNYGGTDILLLPWICDDNYDRILRSVTESTAPLCMGHLELNGFEAHPGHVMKTGTDMSMFRKFKKVFTGHYHTKSHMDNCYYLGNPYQLYWSDYGMRRGFHVLDTDTYKTTFYRNPFDTFHKLYYNGRLDLPDESKLEGTFVKLIVEDKGDYAKFDYNIKRLQDMKLADLKIVEDLSVDLENGDSVVETEDTLTLLDNYINDIDIRVSKDNVKQVMRSLYMEAAEL